MKRIWTWIGWLVLPLCLSAPAPAGEATVPLTKVTSYSSGVAYFETTAPLPTTPRCC